jgi:UDP-N-acetylglucosamine transferase subunit ALG13
LIFVTVGAQMPFDRLIRTADEWAGRAGRRDVHAQIGDSGFIPSHMTWERLLPPGRFRELAQGATAIVAHAGMGTILTALELGTPILVMPRRGELRETRNDHQWATCARVEALGVAIARDETELLDRLGRIDDLKPAAAIRGFASPELIETLRRFIAAETR